MALIIVLLGGNGSLFSLLRGRSQYLFCLSQCIFLDCSHFPLQISAFQLTLLSSILKSCFYPQELLFQLLAMCDMFPHGEYLRESVCPQSIEPKQELPPSQKWLHLFKEI